mgnify:CR=1 FL=1
MRLKHLEYYDYSIRQIINSIAFTGTKGGWCLKMVLKKMVTATELSDKLDALSTKFAAFESFEEKTSRIVEEKVYEIKAIVYLILIITAILLFLVLGVLLKAVGF